MATRKNSNDNKKSSSDDSSNDDSQSGDETDSGKGPINSSKKNYINPNRDSSPKKENKKKTQCNIKTKVPMMENDEYDNDNDNDKDKEKNSEKSDDNNSYAKSIHTLIIETTKISAYSNDSGKDNIDSSNEEIIGINNKKTQEINL